MAKKETQGCRSCGHKFAVDKTQCPSCRTWNIEPKNSKGAWASTRKLSDADEQTIAAISTGPWDPCFGRSMDERGKETFGLIPSSVTLIGGAPGAGKSTLIAHIADNLLDKHKGNALIVSAEEIDPVLKSRARRLKLKHMDRVHLASPHDELGEILLDGKPIIVFVDSLSKVCPDMDLQVVYAKRFKEYMVELGIPGVLIDHVNKEEELAGMQALQHEVDTTLLYTLYDEVRELRSVKNRNGPTANVFFTMEETGLKHYIPTEDDEDDE
jgi:DNA repair protein RadA/Sms